MTVNLLNTCTLKVSNSKGKCGEIPDQKFVFVFLKINGTIDGTGLDQAVTLVKLTRNNYLN